MRKLIGLPILALILCSCSFKPLTDKFNEVTAPDYVNSSKAEKLQLPPDLSEYETSDTYNIPEQRLHIQIMRIKEIGQ